MSAQPISPSPLTPLHVLLVEDTPADARMIQAILRPPSFEITHVESLSDAMAVLRSACVDVVLLDLMLPDSSGAETLDSVRVEAGGTAVLVITGNEPAALDAASRGAQDYLIKGGANAETIVRSVRYAFERSCAEARLRASEERFRALVENGSDGIALVDREGNILYSSPAITRVLGYSVEEFTGTNFLTLLHPDDLLEGCERLASVLANGFRSTFERDLRYRHCDGTWRYLEVLRANRLDDPAVRAIVANLRDVTERRQALETTDQLRRRYEAILNSIADGVHGIDWEGRITFENPAAAAMLGWDASALFGKRAHETFHHSRQDATPRNEEDCPILATIANGVVRHVTDDVFWRKDGTPFNVEYVAAPTPDGDGKRGAVVAFRDITKQQAMQRQVDQAVRVSSLGRVAASVAHEFNNVLLGIQPFVEILSRNAGDDAVQQQPLKHILNAVRRGRAVSNQILRFASPAEPRLASLDLGEWTRNFSEEARLMLRDRKLEVATAESLVVRANSEQLSQVVSNLVRNASDASPAGAIIAIGAASAATIPFLQERLANPHRFAALFVRDHGMGIPQEALEHIFEPLFTTKKHGGTGLGLAVVHQIIADHEGEVLVESTAGSGSTFYIALPLEEPIFQVPEAGGESITL